MGGIYDVVKERAEFECGQLVYWNPVGDPVEGKIGSGAATAAEIALVRDSNEAEAIAKVREIAGRDCGHAPEEMVRNQIGGHTGVDCLTCHARCVVFDYEHPDPDDALQDALEMLEPEADEPFHVKAPE